MLFVVSRCRKHRWDLISRQLTSAHFKAESGLISNTIMIGLHVAKTEYNNSCADSMHQRHSTSHAKGEPPVLHSECRGSLLRRGESKAHAHAADVAVVGPFRPGYAATAAHRGLTPPWNKNHAARQSVLHPHLQPRTRLQAHLHPREGKRE